MDALQMGLLLAGGLALVVLALYNRWVSRRSAPRQAEPAEATSGAASDASEREGAVEPVLEDDLKNLPQPERKPVLDALIDAIIAIDLEQAVSGEAALAAMPHTRRVGSKAFHVEGSTEPGGPWELLQAGRRYLAFQAGVQLANRTGPLNDIEYSEFVVKTQAFADAVGGTPALLDMREQVARSRELDEFASAHDAQLSLVLVARQTAWSAGYIHQHAARLGFVAGVMPGRMVLPAAQQGMPPILSLTFDTQAALAEDPAHSAIRECVLSLDVPHVPRSEQPFARLQHVAQELAQHMDGVITDGGGQALLPQVMAQIGQDLEQLYDKLDERELSAGSAQARRLFS